MDSVMITIIQTMEQLMDNKLYRTFEGVAMKIVMKTEQIFTDATLSEVFKNKKVNTEKLQIV